MGEFGEKFRKAREKKELSLDDVSNVTKISTRMLQAIEEEHFDQLPGGIFNRGFIRAYAKHVGLDSEDAVNDYLACLRQAQVESHAAWDAAQRTQQRAAPSPSKGNSGAPANGSSNLPAPIEIEELPDLQLPRAEHIRPAKKEYLGRPSAEIPWLRIALIICVLISAVFLWTRHSRNRTAGAAANTAPVSQPSAPVAAAPAPQSPPSSQPSPPPVATASPAPLPSPESVHASPATEPATVHTTATAPTPATSADPDAVNVERKGDVTIRSFGAPPVTPIEKPAATLTLIVRANENSWISVTCDGQLVTQETLIAPAATSFHATRELVVRVGNAAGVSFLWNGEELPPQGAEAEAKTFVFDAQGMRPAPSPQN